MLRASRRIAAAVAVLLGCATPIAAADTADWGASLGQFDFAQEESAVELGVDYGFRPLRFGLVPVVGIGATSDEAFFGYGGLRRPFRLGDGRWELTPKFGITLFERGDGKDLGRVLEFRSGLELVRQLESGLRVGAGFYHISNASIDEVNPGANSLLLRVQWPRK